jgi:hypothetical protein
MLVIVEPANILPQDRAETQRSKFARQTRSRHTKQGVLHRNHSRRKNRNDEEPANQVSYSSHALHSRYSPKRITIT